MPFYLFRRSLHYFLIPTQWKLQSIDVVVAGTNVYASDVENQGARLYETFNLSTFQSLFTMQNFTNATGCGVIH
jgi:hypothetical protein